MIDSPNIFVTILSFLTMIGILVIIHELGHYYAGRFFGVKAEKFSIGFGPQIFGRVDKRGTLWRVALLPLGGYVQFAGDANAASQNDDAWKEMPEEERAHSFPAKPLWQRAIIVFAGPATNFILAIAIMAGFFMTYGQVVMPARIDQVQAQSPADKMGIKKGDLVTSFNGVEMENFPELAREISIYGGQNVEIDIVRDGQKMTLMGQIGHTIMTDKFGNEQKIGQLGIGASGAEIREVPIYEAPWLAVKETGAIIRLTVTGLGQILSGQRSVKELGGPVKIAKISGEQFTLGLAAFISLIAMISINLGFINLLPIPMLDGGHLLLYGIEAVTRKPPNPAIQEWAFRVGFIFLIGFMLVVTYNDILSLV
ncbi:RIP metalloprotease RseP [Sphingorhabdus lutea]|uniref:Zinc metalloprotease n=1 Tax=Sphingorhabdus lutea TaxID=1913578 RepID=A0A1L3JCZ0_9SPHN|nr:RIP metalloprotease RseP [Sphingorhabdus lutea]APG62933.1 RIP metalloprotease RseP [Sphingorhabdus lutea]